MTQLLTKGQLEQVLLTIAKLDPTGALTALVLPAFIQAARAVDLQAEIEAKVMASAEE